MRTYPESSYMVASCAHCGLDFRVLPWERKRGKGKYCSPACHQKANPPVGRAFGAGLLNPKYVDGGSSDKARDNARHALRYAVKRGKVVKPLTCSKCGSDYRIQGHHEDYAKPLEVIWLCEPCHRSITPRSESGTPTSSFTDGERSSIPPWAVGLITRPPFFRS